MAIDAPRPTEGQEFQSDGEVLVWHADRKGCWSCTMCMFQPVTDCEPVLEAKGLPDCFQHKGYYTVYEPIKVLGNG